MPYYSEPGVGAQEVVHTAVPGGRREHSILGIQQLQREGLPILFRCRGEFPQDRLCGELDLLRPFLCHLCDTHRVLFPPCSGVFKVLIPVGVSYHSATPSAGLCALALIEVPRSSDRAICPGYDLGLSVLVPPHPLFVPEDHSLAFPMGSLVFGPSRILTGPSSTLPEFTDDGHCDTLIFGW